MRLPLRSVSSGPANADPSSVIDKERARHASACTESSMARSGTLRAIGPRTPIMPAARRRARPPNTAETRAESEQVVPAGRVAQAAGMVAAVGRLVAFAAPTRRRHRRCCRLPSVTGRKRCGSHHDQVVGVRAKPEFGRIGLTDEDRAGPLRSRSTMTLSAGGTKSPQDGRAMVIECPLTGTRSFTANGKPCSGPISSPRPSCTSCSRACSSRSARSCNNNRIHPRIESRSDRDRPS